MKEYILCKLDDESYAHPSFSFHESFEEAQKKAIETIIDVFDYAEGYNLQLGTEDPESEKDIIDGVRISANWGENGNSFYVTEFFPIDESKGTHLLVWHHAYDGVGFKILLQGTYEECLAERRKQIKELYEESEAGNWGGDNSDINLEEDDIIDTGNEWEMWSIVEIE